MSRVSDEVRDRAELLGEELLSLLLELAERERGFEGSGADHTLREALTVIAAFRESKALDDAAIGDLARCRLLLDKAQAMIGDEVGREAVRDATDFVDKLRARSIELMVERDRAQAVDRSAPQAPAAELVLGLGTPALVKGVSIAVPRLFEQGSEAALAARATAAELAEEEDEVEREGPAGELAIAERVRSRHGDAGERAQIEALARDAMEDLAAFSTLRVLSEDAPWKDGEGFERRLLANVDSLIALARPVRSGAAELDLAEALFAYATEWAVPDRGRAFAFALTLCCVDSDAALLWVTIGLRRAADKTLPAYVDALALGSNPRIASKLVGLLSDDVPRELLIVALQVALRRRLFHAGRMVALSSHPDAEVAALATRCFAFAPPALAQAALSELALTNSPAVRAAAAATMIEIGMAQGRQVLREVIDETVGRGKFEPSGPDHGAVRGALRALAVNADPKDADRIWASARALQSYREVGFFGHAAHVPLLFATLDELDGRGASSDVPAQLWLEQIECVAGAIRRITGIDPPSFGTGRYDLPGFKQLWTQHGPDVQAVAAREGRVRFGKAWSKKGIVEELSRPGTVHGDRRLLADELALASGGELRFDVDGWIASQRAFLKMVGEAWD